MKTIGLLGGMSWESTTEYYRIINEAVKRRCGGLHSAKCVLYSVDFEEIEVCQRQGDWEQAASILVEAARGLEQAGADCILICANTMHKVAGPIEAAVNIPLIHIADATAEAVMADQIDKVGLLGTRYTMEQAFYLDRLRARGLEVLVPEASDRQVVHTTIYDELCLGEIRPESRDNFLHIIADLQGRGAEGIILGCTEIGLLIDSEIEGLRLYDTTRIHALKAVEYALK